jgi:hypothetical protein
LLPCWLRLASFAHAGGNARDGRARNVHGAHVEPAV